jgi:hypothetical protein
MHIGNALINGLIVSSIILLIAVFFGIKADKKLEEKQAVPRRPQRSRRRSVELKPQARVRVGASGGR